MILNHYEGTGPKAEAGLKMRAAWDYPRFWERRKRLISESETHTYKTDVASRTDSQRSSVRRGALIKGPVWTSASPWLVSPNTFLSPSFPLVLQQCCHSGYFYALSWRKSGCNGNQMFYDSVYELLNMQEALKCVYVEVQ